MQEFQFESVFNLEFQPKFGIQLGIPIPMGINLGECIIHKIFFHRTLPYILLSDFFTPSDDLFRHYIT